MYHIIDSAPVAQLAFDLGFIDIDTVDGEGFTPLMQQPRATNNHLWSAYTDWLIAHGANVSRLMPYATGIANAKGEVPPAHTVAHRVLSILATAPPRNTTTERLLESLSVVSVGDECVCGCADPSIGCTPSSIFLRTAVIGFGNRELTNFPSKLEPHIRPIRFQLIIRLLTFERLELRHTCCNHFESYGASEYGDDFAELRDEDSITLQRLDQLVGEFTSLFEESGLDVATFVQTMWNDRMEEELEEKMEELSTSDSESADEELEPQKLPLSPADYLIESLSRIANGDLERYPRRNNYFRFEDDDLPLGYYYVPECIDM